MVFYPWTNYLFFVVLKFSIVLYMSTVPSILLAKIWV